MQVVAEFVLLAVVFGASLAVLARLVGMRDVRPVWLSGVAIYALIKAFGPAIGRKLAQVRRDSST